MKAAQYHSHGDPNVIQIDIIEPPQPNEKQLTVEIYASSINPFDYKVRSGKMPGMPKSFPVTIGADFAGVVTKTAEDFSKGDKVYGQAGFYTGGSGSMAEFATASISKVSKMPTNINYEEAAALPLAGISALQALEEHINLQPDQKILIHGGAGGIGSYAIQIAKAHHAYVATTVSSDDIEFVKSLGADEIIDYHKQNFVDFIHDFDAVFDTAGEKTWDASITALKEGGIIVSMNGQPNPTFAQERGVVSIGQGTNVTSEKLARLTELVEEGKVKSHIDKVFSLDHAREAFIYQETQSPRGKVVVKVR